MLSVSPQTIMSSWEFRKSAIPCRSSGCSSKTTIRVFTGCFSGADIYVRVRKFLPSRRRKCQAGNFAAGSCCPQISQISADLMRPQCSLENFFVSRFLIYENLWKSGPRESADDKLLRDLLAVVSAVPSGVIRPEIKCAEDSGR